jgi:N-acetylneuraminate synthase
MILEPAEPTETHARIIMAWRNDPITLENSFHQQPKQWPEFYDEFVETYFDPLPPLFGIRNGERVGLLRFRRYDDVLPVGDACDISIMIAPEQRGRGYGNLLVAMGTAYAHEQGWRHVIAEVLPENTISLRLFLGVGYHQLDEHPRRIHDIAKPITVIRFVHSEE